MQHGKELDISTLSITELKALAFDQTLMINQAQQILTILQREIEKRGEDEQSK